MQATRASPAQHTRPHNHIEGDCADSAAMQASACNRAAGQRATRSERRYRLPGCRLPPPAGSSSPWLVAPRRSAQRA